MVNVSFLTGLRVIRDQRMVLDSGERSWARVRSPGRARRRLVAGHRQNIDVVWVPDPNLLMTSEMIIGHPATIARMLAQIERVN